MVIMGNKFLNCFAESYYGNKFGSGSVMVLSASVDLSKSIYFGSENVFSYCWSENKGFLKEDFCLLSL